MPIPSPSPRAPTASSPPGPVRGGSHLAPHEVRDAFEAAFSADRFVNGWDMLESRPPRKPEVYEMHTGTLFEYDPELPVGNLPASPRNDRRATPKAVRFPSATRRPAGKPTAA